MTAKYGRWLTWERQTRCRCQSGAAVFQLVQGSEFYPSCQNLIKCFPTWHTALHRTKLNIFHVIPKAFFLREIATAAAFVQTSVDASASCFHGFLIGLAAATSCFHFPTERIAFSAIVRSAGKSSDWSFLRRMCHISDLKTHHQAAFTIHSFIFTRYIMD